MYVLEHLVCPEKILDEMLRVTKEGGHAILLFPDFLRPGRFVSQQAGFGFGTAKEKLKQGTLPDTVVTFYDNRLRFPKMLKRLKRRIGGFTVHLQPACLYYPNMAHPDFDAVYIASKAEVMNWAIRQGYGVYLPKGVQGLFKDHAFVVI